MTNRLHALRPATRSLVSLVVCLLTGVVTLAASSLAHTQEALRPPARPRLMCRGGLSIDNAVSPCKLIQVDSPAPVGAKVGDSCTALVQWLGPEVGVPGLVVARILR